MCASPCDIHSLAEPQFGRMKKIYIFKNGKAGCYLFNVVPRNFRTWNSVLQHLTSILKPNFGPIKRLLELKTNKFVESFEELKAYNKYVALGYSGTLKMPAGGYRTPKIYRRRQFNKRLYSGTLDAKMMCFLNETRKKGLTIIYMVRNGVTVQVPRKIVLRRNDLNNWDLILRFLGQKLDIPEGVAFICTIFGDMLCDPKEFQHGYIYVAIAYQEHFIPLDYLSCFERLCHLYRRNYVSLIQQHSSQLKHFKKKKFINTQSDLTLISEENKNLHLDQTGDGVNDKLNKRRENKKKSNRKGRMRVSTTRLRYDKRGRQKKTTQKDKPYNTQINAGGEGCTTNRNQPNSNSTSDASFLELEGCFYKEMLGIIKTKHPCCKKLKDILNNFCTYPSTDLELNSDDDQSAENTPEEFDSKMNEQSSTDSEKLLAVTSNSVTPTDDGLKKISHKSGRFSEINKSFKSSDDVSGLSVNVRDPSYKSSRMSDVSSNSGNVRDASHKSGRISDDSGISGSVRDASYKSGRISAASGISGSVRNPSYKSSRISDNSGISGSVREPSYKSGRISDVSGISGSVREPSYKSGRISDVSGISGSVREPSYKSGRLSNVSGISESVREPSYKSSRISDVSVMSASVRAPSYKSGRTSEASMRDSSYKSVRVNDASDVPGSVREPSYKSGRISEASMRDPSYKSDRISDISGVSSYKSGIPSVVSGISNRTNKVNGIFGNAQGSSRKSGRISDVSGISGSVRDTASHKSGRISEVSVNLHPKYAVNDNTSLIEYASRKSNRMNKVCCKSSRLSEGGVTPTNSATGTAVQEFSHKSSEICGQSVLLQVCTNSPSQLNKISGNLGAVGSCDCKSNRITEDGVTSSSTTEASGIGTEAFRKSSILNSRPSILRRASSHKTNRVVSSKLNSLKIASDNLNITTQESNSRASRITQSSAKSNRSINDTVNVERKSSQASRRQSGKSQDGVNVERKGSQASRRQSRKSQEHSANIERKSSQTSRRQDEKSQQSVNVERKSSLASRRQSEKSQHSSKHSQASLVSESIGNIEEPSRKFSKVSGKSNQGSVIGADKRISREQSRINEYSDKRLQVPSTKTSPTSLASDHLSQPRKRSDIKHDSASTYELCEAQEVEKDKDTCSTCLISKKSKARSRTCCTCPRYAYDKSTRSRSCPPLRIQKKNTIEVCNRSYTSEKVDGYSSMGSSILPKTCYCCKLKSTSRNCYRSPVNVCI